MNRRVFLLSSTALVCAGAAQAQFGVPAHLGAAVNPTVVTTYATWNPSDKSSQVTLSGGDLTATAGAGAFARNGARSTVSKTTGKFYWELTHTVDDVIQYGLADSSFSLDSNTANNLGLDSHGLGIVPTTGVVKCNNVTVGTGQTFTTGQTCCIAVDFGAQLFWYRRNGNNWNNDAGADPAAGTGGFSSAGIAGTPVFACVMLRSSGGSDTTVNFGATAFSFTVPTGYTSGFTA